jgi:hypothetical protein
MNLPPKDAGFTSIELSGPINPGCACLTLMPPRGPVATIGPLPSFLFLPPPIALADTTAWHHLLRLTVLVAVATAVGIAITAALGFGLSSIRALCLAALLFGLTGSICQAQAPPDVVKETPNLNLGGSSYYDGFGRYDPGWVVQNYLREQHYTTITTSTGAEDTAFVNPHIDALVNILQAIYVFPVQVSGGGIGVETLLPLVYLRSHFDSSGVVLDSNGFGLGDFTFGPFYQAKPLALDGRPFFSWRTALDAIAPVGAWDSGKDINQSSGFWSVNPYLAATVLPTSSLEFSARLNYIYNFQTQRGANPPQLPGFIFHDGQAGQALWVNFTTSYAVTKAFSLGVNGFYLQQLTDDQTNGVAVLHSREMQVYLGPGFHWAIGANNTLNGNLYVPIVTKNVATGLIINFQFIHVF